MTKSHAVQAFASIDVDIGKDVFHIIGFDAQGKIALRKKIKRLAISLPDAPSGLISTPQVARDSARPWS